MADLNDIERAYLQRRADAPGVFTITPVGILLDGLFVMDSEGMDPMGFALDRRTFGLQAACVRDLRRRVWLKRSLPAQWVGIIGEETPAFREAFLTSRFGA